MVEKILFQAHFWQKHLKDSPSQGCKKSPSSQPEKVTF